ncbi:MAG: dephospho-CoA kinase [Elusimicrobiota bacterium]
MKRRALTVGLTGGIGSGKSEALRAFARLGADTLSLDEVAHQVLRKGAAGYRPVVRVFGRDILDARGEIDRRILGRIVFGAPRARRRLERLTQPAIARELRRRLRAHRRGLLVVEAPLLFETGWEKDFDLTVVVAAGCGKRLRRLARRDRLPAAQLRRRMAAQLPAAEKAARADVVLSNDGTRRGLRDKVREYHKAFELIYGG